MCYIVNSVLNHNPYFIHFPDSTSCFKYKLYVQYQWFTSLHCVNLNRQNLIRVVGVRSALTINHLLHLRICCHTSMKFNRFSNKKNKVGIPPFIKEWMKCRRNFINLSLTLCFTIYCRKDGLVIEGTTVTYIWIRTNNYALYLFSIKKKGPSYDA